MVGVSGRSKGCATCRRRKIKCDLTLPHCVRCLESRLSCPGPRTGAFFVHTSTGTNQATVKAAEHMPVAQVHCTELSRRHGATSQYTQVLVRTAPAMTPAMRACRATAYDQLFLSHFIDSFGYLSQKRFCKEAKTTWLEDLPAYIHGPAPGRGNALAMSSIRASAMVRYGTWTGNAAVTAAAHQVYAKALRDLGVLVSSPSAELLTESTVCAAVMLMHFETDYQTVPGAWIKHVRGAATLLEAAGPAACRSGFLHRVFQHLRMQTLLASMHENKTPPFSSPEWCSVPFEVYPANAFDRIVEILLSVQNCLVAVNQLVEDADTASPDERKWELRDKLHHIVKQLDKWAQSYMPKRDMKAFRVYDASLHAHPPPGLSGNYASDSGETNTPVVALASLFHATSLVTLRLLSACHADRAADDAILEHHSCAILSGLNFARTVSGAVSNFGKIMMLPQLKMLSIWGAPSQARAYAMKLWAKESHITSLFADDPDSPPGYFADLAAIILEAAK